MKNTKTNVIIAVRDADLRLSLDLLLREEPCLNVVGTATTSESALGLVKAERPTLVLLEWGLSGRPTEEVLTEIKTSNPSPHVILLGNRTDHKQLASRFGADAFLSIGTAPKSLLSAIGGLISKE